MTTNDYTVEQQPDGWYWTQLSARSSLTAPDTTTGPFKTEAEATADAEHEQDCPVQ